jgi:hypothetical protein
VRATGIRPCFVDTPLLSFAPIDRSKMIRSEVCLEIMRMLLRLSRLARVSEIFERVGS